MIGTAVRYSPKKLSKQYYQRFFIKKNVFNGTEGRPKLEQRQNKNDTISSISKLILKLPLFFTARIGE